RDVVDRACGLHLRAADALSHGPAERERLGEALQTQQGHGAGHGRAFARAANALSAAAKGRTGQAVSWPGETASSTIETVSQPGCAYRQRGLNTQHDTASG